MSTIGSPLGATNLASSAAGVQRNAADSDRLKKNAADQKTAADRNALSARALGDVAEAENSPDRDADGRRPYAAGSPSGQSADDGTDGLGKREPEPVDQRGQRLDLQA